jgi:hypothetical protein
MRLPDVTGRLTTFGLGHVVLPSGTDGAVLLLPDYGRVLGLWAGLRAESALWINPDFLERLAIGSKDDGWTNPGGERMWLAPGREFVPEDGDVPASLDPGHFTGKPDHASYLMENRGEVRAWEAGSTVRFSMSRRVQALPDSAIEELWGKTWLRRAGCVEETRLSVSGPCPPQARLASYTQVPATASGHASIRAPGKGMVSGVLCIVPGESGHSQLIVKVSDAPSEEGAALLESRWGGRGTAREVSCLSAPMGRASRLVWKTSLCVFSGRSEEIEAMAARLSS